MRELWRHEERDFSIWLKDNIDKLADRLGIPLSDVERERPAGNFECDLIATSGGRRVVIENQLQVTNHDHLGKMLV